MRSSRFMFSSPGSMPSAMSASEFLSDAPTRIKHVLPSARGGVYPEGVPGQKETTHTGPHCSAVCLGTPHSGDRMAAGSAPHRGVERGPGQGGTRYHCSCCPGCCRCGSRIGSSWDCPSRSCCSSCRRESRGSSPLATTPNRFITCRRHDRLHAGSVNATSACIRCCNSNSVPRPASHTCSKPSPCRW